MPLRLHTGTTISLSSSPTTSTPQAILSVPIFTQQQSRWCWCACCEMVLDFLASRKQQCDTAEHGLSVSGCCGSPLPVACNGMIWTIHPLLTDISDVYTHFSCPTKHSGSSITFTTLRAEIDPPNAKPIEVCFAWSGGGAHVAIVCGYRDDPHSGQYVYVNDPDPARTGGWVSYSSLLSSYGAGTWTETFRF